MEAIVLWVLVLASNWTFTFTSGITENGKQEKRIIKGRQNERAG